MCGTYYLDKQLKYDLERWVIMPQGIFKYGDVRPGDPGLIITDGYQGMIKEWGYLVHNKRIFNARIESVLDKKLFREDAINRRCIIPVRGFYEWDEHHVKYRFFNHKIIYLAGIYHNHCFTILTKEADEIMKGIHTRMPVIVAKEDINLWLKEGRVLKKTKDILEKEILGPYVQLSLFD